MITLTNCQTYTTPWCNLIGCRNNGGENALHLFYKLQWLQDEIEKRSSYLGKFRRTEETTHLLDLIAMTKDEEDLFFPFAKAAMADVFDALEQYAPNTKKAYMWNEGQNSIIIPSLPDTNNITDLQWVTFGNDKLTITFKWDEAKNTLTKKTIIYQVNYNDDTTEDLTFETKGYVMSWSKTFDYITKPVRDVVIKGVTVEWLSNIEYKEGDFVEYDGKVFFASSAGNYKNLEGLNELPVDWRRSIHYMLAFPSTWHSNMVEPLDTAIFEALTARIIFKWLLNSYPVEAPRFLSEWQECLENIKKRCFLLFGNKIVNRTPRMF